jgi:hypothetical protein
VEVRLLGLLAFYRMLRIKFNVPILTEHVRELLRKQRGRHAKFNGSADFEQGIEFAHFQLLLI